MSRVGHSLPDWLNSEPRHRIVHPIDQGRPISHTKEDDREVCQLAGLNQRQGLEQLVHRPISARENDKAMSVLGKHHLPHKKVHAFMLGVEKRVWFLLVG